MVNAARQARIGPGSGRKFFQELAEWDVCPRDDSESGLLECDRDSVLEFIDALRMSSPYVWRRPLSNFSFLASSSLSGGGMPCSELDCREERVSHLVNFATLYADCVLIQDPFWSFLDRRDSQIARLDLLATLIALKQMRPLIEAGLVAFAPSDFAVCEDCKKGFLKAHEARVSLLDRSAEAFCSPESGVTVTRHPKDKNAIVVGGLEGLIDHEIVLKDLSGSQASAGPRLTPRRKRVLIEQFLTDPVVNDLSYYATIRDLYGVRYLTDRALDIRLLQDMPRERRPPSSPTGARALRHALPILQGVPVRDLLKLRKEEGEAFALYRDAFNKVLGLAKSEDDVHLRQAFEDHVVPEIHRIEVAVRAAKKIVKSSIREKVVFATASVAVGLAIGQVSPNLGAITAALGGAPYVTRLLEDLNSMAKEPGSLRENEFYFLWRATKLSRAERHLHN